MRDNINEMTVLNKEGVKETMTVAEWAGDHLGWEMEQNIWRQMIWIGVFIAVMQVGSWLATTFISFNKR